MLNYREWGMIADTIAPNPFTEFFDELSWMNILPDKALSFFKIDYASAVTVYTNADISLIFKMVKMTNSVKYQKLIVAATAKYDPIDNYNMTETSTDIRTPNLTSQLTLNTTAAMTDTRSTTTSGGNRTQNKINQMRKTEENPNDFKETATHFVNPYDGTGFTKESEDITKQDGIRIIEESYSGDADETTVTGNSTTTNKGGTSTTNTGTNTQTETGTDTTEHTLTRKGNIGVTTSQQMLESEIVLAAKMNIFKIIEQDLAEKLFLQVWI